MAFDLMTDAQQRLGYDQFCQRMTAGGFVLPSLLHRGEPLSITEAVKKLGSGHHGSLDLPEITGQPALWNWRPD